MLSIKREHKCLSKYDYSPTVPSWLIGPLFLRSIDVDSFNSAPSSSVHLPSSSHSIAVRPPGIYYTSCLSSSTASRPTTATPHSSSHRIPVLQFVLLQQLFQHSPSSHLACIPRVPYNSVVTQSSLRLSDSQTLGLSDSQAKPSLHPFNRLVSFASSILATSKTSRGAPSHSSPRQLSRTTPPR